MQLELLHDFREVASANPDIFEGTVTNVIMPVIPLNGATNTAVSTTTLGVSFDAVNFTEEDYVNITIPVNPNQAVDLVSEDAVYNIISEDGYELINEEAEYNVIPIQFVHTLQNGDNEVNYSYIVQGI